MANVADLLTELDSAAVALEEASKLLFAKGLQGSASIIMGHADRARAAIAKAEAEAEAEAQAALNSENSEMIALSNGRLA